jgi:hypothetical protein
VQSGDNGGDVDQPMSRVCARLTQSGWVKAARRSSDRRGRCLVRQAAPAFGPIDKQDSQHGQAVAGARARSARRQFRIDPADPA